MLRTVLSVIAGYATMFVGVFVTFSVAYLMMGADRAFAPGSFQISMTWAITSFVLGFVAAVAGGLVCAEIARPGSKAPLYLAIVVLALGVLQAGVVLMAAPPEEAERTAEVGNLEAMQQAETPLYVALANPIVGVFGVLLGSRLHRKSTAQTGVAADEAARASGGDSRE